MYSTSSSQFNQTSKHPKSKLSSSAQQTGLQFACRDINHHRGDRQEHSFSFQIEAQRQYVYRLKNQRQKIQALYSKYDCMIQDMKKKQQKIKQQQRKIGELSNKCKEYSLLMPELDVLRKQNGQLIVQNQAVRVNIMGIEQSYINVINDYKSKSTLTQKQKQRIEEFNEQLVSKIRLLQQKVQDRYVVHQKQKKQLIQKNDHTQKQMLQLKNKHISQISIMNNQILRRQEQIDILQKQTQRLRSVIFDLEQNCLNQGQYHGEQIQKIHLEYKAKIKLLKQQIQQHNYTNELLTNKISTLNTHIQKITQQSTNLRDLLADQRLKHEQSQYELKLVFNQQKSIMREQTLQFQSKLNKVQKLLAQSLRREKDMVGNIRRIQEGEQVKRSLREVQRRQLEKINRLLLIQK